MYINTYSWDKNEVTKDISEYSHCNIFQIPNTKLQDGNQEMIYGVV